MSEVEFENFYKERLEEKIIFGLAKRKNIDLKTAMSAYYTSFLSRLIEQGSYGIQYLDSELLTDELEKELTKDF